MTSLSVIMDMNDDDQDARAIKKDGASQGGRRYAAPSSSSSNSAQPGLVANQSSASSSSGARRRSSSKKSLSTSSATAQPPQPPQQPPQYTGSAPTTSSSAPSLQEIDPMDHHGYGHPGPSAATMRMRSLGPNSRTDAENAVKLTPITGRVSRAKKGMPVHVCETCKPPKTFTRAEHLRRHRLSHEKPKYPCQYSGCEKAFHRHDLLQRHQQRHETDGDRGSTTTAASRRASHSSSTSQPATSPYPNSYHQTGATKSPSAQPISPPAQSPGFPSVLQPPTTYPQSQNQYAPAPTTSLAGYSPGMYTPNGNTTTVTEAPYQAVSSTGVLAPPTRQNSWPVGGSQPVYQSTMYPPASQYGYPEQISYQYGAGIGPETGMGEGYQFQGMASPIVVAPPSVSSAATSILSRYPNTPGQPLPSPSPNRLAPNSAFGQWSSSSTPSMSSATMSAGTLPLAQGDLFPTGMDLDTDVAMLMAPQMMQGLTGMPSSCIQLRGVQQPSMANMREFLDVYFSKVAPKLPVVHISSATLEEEKAGEFGGIGNPVGPIGASKTQVLQCAMAAVASQFVPGREARALGDRMHLWASSEVKGFPERTNIKVMQTIILCEYYSRFRGRKAAVRPSAGFECVYRLLDEDQKKHNLLQPHPITTFADWVDLETRRRLLSACFLLDIHSNTLQSQETLTSRLLSVHPGHPLPIPLTGPTAQLWECPDEPSWKALLHSDDRLRNVAKAAPELVPWVQSIDPGRAASIGQLLFDGCLITVAEALSLWPDPNATSAMGTLPGPQFGYGEQSSVGKLSSSASSASLSSSTSQSTLGSDDDAEDDGGPVDTPKMAREIEEMEQLANKASDQLLFPNNPASLTYAALRVTPLIPLLAVSGETYLFAHKITTMGAFKAHKRRLRAWVNSRACGIAAKWAAKALLGLLEVGSDGQESWTQEISGYWMVYVCVLILWAFGHHQGSPLGGENAGEDETAVLSWLKKVSETKGEQVEHLPRQRALSEGLVRATKRRLHAEAASGLNKLFVDAIRVLSKLDERGDKTWF